MESFKILSTIQITKDDKIKLNSVTFDGSCFYFTESKSNKIYKYTIDLEFLCSYKTKYIYRSICYDQEEDCFWASYSKHTLIKLDHSFKEIDMLTIKDYDKSFGRMEGINYDFYNNKLLIAYQSAIIELSKNEDAGILTKQKESGIYYYSALELDGVYVCSYVKNNFPELSVIDNDDGSVIQCRLPEGHYLKDMTLYFDKTCKEKFIFMLTSKQGDYACLIKYKLICSGENFMDSDCIDERDDQEWDEKEFQNKEWDEKEPENQEWDEKEPENKEWDEKEPENKEWDEKEPENQEWDEKEPENQECDEKEPENQECDEKKPKYQGRDEKKPKYQARDKKKPKKQKWDERECDPKEYCNEKCMDSGHHCKEPCEFDECYTNVIESVALLQKSLSQLLNIEAKEIQKALDCSNSADEILEVNDAVRHNITRALHLEQLLFTILDSFNETRKKVLKT